MVRIRKLSVPEVAELCRKRGFRPDRRLCRQLKKDPRQGVRKIWERVRREFMRLPESKRLRQIYLFERSFWAQGLTTVVGVDEAGVGPLAGPVVAAAVVLAPRTQLPGIDDSKKLDEPERLALASLLRRRAVAYGVAQASVAEIDRLNIYQAGRLAMRRAVAKLPLAADVLLVDAREISVPGFQISLIKGDALSASIAAASILAKTARDRLLRRYAVQFPEYGFDRHKGYATKDHQEALRKQGPCPLHRASFPAVHEAAGAFSSRFYTLRERFLEVTSAQELESLVDREEASFQDLNAAEEQRLRALLARRRRAVSQGPTLF